MNSAISFRMMSQNMFDDLGPTGPGQNQMMGMPGPGPSPGPMPGPGQMPVSMPGPFPPPRSMGPQFGMPPGNKVNVHVHLLNEIFNETIFYVFKQKIKFFSRKNCVSSFRHRTFIVLLRFHYEYHRYNFRVQGQE